MKFTKWLEKYDEAYHEAILNHAKIHGLKIKDKTTIILPDVLENKSRELFIAYQQQKTNKRLVWATWSLAFATIVLSILSLFVGF